MLILASAEHFLPAVFGPGIARALPLLARGGGTLFSHEHAWIVESGGTAAGMLLGYTGREKSREDPRTGLALLRLLGPGMLLRLRRLLLLQGVLGGIRDSEYYVSNVAVSPHLRGRGFGGALLGCAESRAAASGASDLVLDVETDNHGARRLYERWGYTVRARSAEVRMGGRTFSFYRMVKPAPARTPPGGAEAWKS